jgi:hypothetical protein
MKKDIEEKYAEDIEWLNKALTGVFHMPSHREEILSYLIEQIHEQELMFEYFDFIDIVEKGLNGTVESPGPDEQ